MQFAAGADVDEDGAMAPGNVGVLNDHVVFGGAADRVDADLQGVDVLVIDQPEVEAGRRLVGVLDERVGVAAGIVVGVGLDGQRVGPAARNNSSRARR